MNESIYFRAWVANAVHAVSGIWAYDWSGSQRKHALTCEEIRMAACQVAGDENSHVLFRDSMRLCQLGAANLVSASKNLH